MSEMSSEAGPANDAAQVFFRTVTGIRVHLPECPHLVGAESHAASAGERLRHPVCDWSQAQIAGYGRQHFDSVEDAMRRVGVPVEAHDEILRALRFVTSDEIFVVHSLTYGALALEGRVVASFGKTYYWVGDRRVNLPSYVDTARAGHRAVPSQGDICPIHFEQMSLTGECGQC